MRTSGGGDKGCDFGAEFDAHATQQKGELAAHSQSLRGAASGQAPGTKPMPVTHGQPLDQNDHAFSAGQGGHGPGGGRIPPEKTGVKLAGAPGTDTSSRGGGPTPPNTTGQKLRGSRG